MEAEEFLNDHMVMPNQMQRERAKISTTISVKDWRYCKAHNLKWSQIIREYVRNHEEAHDPRLREKMEEHKRRSESLSEKLHNMLNHFKKELGEQKFADIFEKV